MFTSEDFDDIDIAAISPCLQSAFDCRICR